MDFIHTISIGEKRLPYRTWLNSLYNKEKWEFTAKEQGRWGQWMENY